MPDSVASTCRTLPCPRDKMTRGGYLRDSLLYCPGAARGRPGWTIYRQHPGNRSFQRCVPEADLASDGVLTAECGQRERIDAQVIAGRRRLHAAAGKPCQPHECNQPPTNPQETLWRGVAALSRLTTSTFPQKCVVRKASGPNQCK